MELPRRGKAVYSSDHVAVTQREKNISGHRIRAGFRPEPFLYRTIRSLLYFLLRVYTTAKYKHQDTKCGLQTGVRMHSSTLPTPSIPASGTCLLPRTPPRTHIRVPIPAFLGSGHMSLFFSVCSWLLLCLPAASAFREPREEGSGHTVTNTARVHSLGDALVAGDWGDARGRQALLQR